MADARDPEEYRKLLVELWRHSFDCLKAVAESQVGDLQSTAETWFESVSKAMAATACAAKN